MRKITIAAIRQTLTGTSATFAAASTLPAVFVSAAASRAFAFLFLPDFVEAVFANLSNLLEPIEEPFVQGHCEFFQRSNYRVIDAVAFHQLVCVRQAEIDAFDLALTLHEVKSVCTDV